MELQKMTMAELVEKWEKLTGKKIKKFSSKAVGIAKILAFVHESQKKLDPAILSTIEKNLPVAPPVIPQKWEKIGSNKPKYGVSNHQFAKTNKSFRDQCANLGIEPTGRQASKFRNQKGFPYWKSMGLKAVNGTPLTYPKK